MSRTNYCLIPFALCLTAVALSGQTNEQTRRIPAFIDDARTVSRAHSHRPEATAQNDRGPVSDNMPMDHLWLLLRRSPERETALQSFLHDQQDPNSADFHHWISGAEFGARFGVTDGEIDAVKGWLLAHGFTVHGALANRMLITFSGTAGDVRRAFHTSMHRLNVNGRAHIANMSDQSVPSALASVVSGVVSLSTIHPQKMVRNVQPVASNYSPTGSPYRYVSPGDLHTIYNFKPLFAAGYTGRGVTVAVLEDSDLYDTSDWSQFRRFSGLSRPYQAGNFDQIHPTLDENPCVAPGPTDHVIEATIDAQYASAAAPEADIRLASCDNSLNFGVYTALINLLNSDTAPPPIVSISYGGAEEQQSTEFNEFVSALYQQAVAEGVSVFVSTGDSGADSNTEDRKNNIATTGISANALGSTPYNVAVGGTDFADVYNGQVSSYWASANDIRRTSAKGYIPEIPWNNSCGSQLIADFFGFTTTYGADGLCNSDFASTYNYVNVSAASGAPSKLYSKPDWQAGTLGVPDDGARDLPDISLFSAISAGPSSSETWGHSYMFCFGGPLGTPPMSYTCSQGYYFRAGGTSFAAPIMAGVQALINQRTGTQWANPAPLYYQLARNEWGASGNAACDASLGLLISAGCAFHDVTAGDITVPCTAGTTDCYTGDASPVGVLSTSTIAYQPAYAAASGWDFATGLGSINVYNFVTAFSNAFSTQLTSSTR